MPPRTLPVAIAAAVVALASTALAVPAAADTALPTAIATPSAPATSGSTTPTPADAPVAITAVLAPSDRSALRDLVDDTGSLSTAARSDRIDDVAPDADRRPAVASALAVAGFTVTATGTWDVAATGTAAQAEALFGVSLVGTGTSMHPTGSVVMPAAFGGAVSAVLGLDARPIVTPSALPGGLSPTDLASAYTAPASATSGSGSTIATVQFSGWNASDLGTYASAVGRSLPSVTQIPIDGASATTPDGNGGELEVALDQEMLLAAAPAAAQRIYFAPMSAAGMYDTYSRIAADVASSHVTAVSTSWGSCETAMSANVRAVLEDAIDRIVAAGATMFAASGDTGAQCPGVSGTSVQYPASSPAVVGVGGTSLTRSGSTWTESTWNNSSGSSGGGMSTTTARPSYQSGVGIAGTTRLVPDIAATADPSRGPGVYIQSKGGYLLGGGTSLAAPLMAGELASTLSARGCSVGVGDVHAVLYAHPVDFRDVTTGTNGTYAAGAGYDLATGLGSPNWSALSTDLPVPAGCSTTTSSVQPTTPTTSATPTPSTTPATGISADGTRAVGPTSLTAGMSIHSPSGQYHLDMQSDGNLVEYGNGKALWSTATERYPGSRLALQDDGNVVLYAPSGRVLWSSHTMGRGSAIVLGLTDTGEVTLSSAGAKIWSNQRPWADTMVPVTTLTAGQSLWDTGLRRQLVMQSDGNLVIYKDGKALWSAHTDRSGGSRFVLQADGNLVVYTAAGRAVWSSATWRLGGAGMQLMMRSDGDLVLTKNGTVVWSTGTKG